MDNTGLKKKVLDFLRSESVMSAAINNPDRPVSTVLLFAVDDDFTFYFATQKNTVKARALSADNKISISVWSHGKMLVQASGIAEEIMDENRINEVFDKLANSVGSMQDFWPPLLQIHSSTYAVYSIKINWMRMLDLGIKSIHSESTFTQII